MVRGRRALVAVLATAAVVLAFGQSSSGVETHRAAPRAAAATEPPSKGTTVIASRNNDGSQANVGDAQAMMSGSGRYVAFVGFVATRADIFVRDLTANTTTQVTVGANGAAPNGNSSQPSITDDGRFVSFLTFATNIPGVSSTTAGAQILAACDLRPSGGNGPQCSTIASDNGNQSIVGFERPRLSPTGGSITWVAGPASTTFVTPTILHVATLCLGCASGPVTTVATITGLPAATSFHDPVLNFFGGQVVYIATTATNGNALCPAGAQCLVRTQVSDNTSVRLDVDPADASVHLGDPPGNGEVVGLDNVSVDAHGNKVAFTFSREPAPVIEFAPPALAPNALTGDGSWELVATVDDSGGVTSQAVSLDNSGAAVDGENGAISSDEFGGNDGRFIAFVTNAPNTNDGTDAGCTTTTPITCAPQVVVRDLKRDPNGGVLKGALATPAAACSAPPCTASLSAGPAPRYDDIVISDTGSRVGFDSSNNDLVTGDSNTGTNPPSLDTFVRTWTPAVTIDAPNATFDVGSPQQGTSIEINVPITVSGFGPLTFTGSFGQFTAISGANAGDFEVIGSTCGSNPAFPSPLFTGETCYVKVRFTPGGQGTRTANLSMTPDQFNSAQPAGTLRGAGGPPLFVAPGDTTRTSLTDSGAQPNGEFGSVGSQSMISGNGRWDVFVSDADLEPSIQNDGFQNIFVRDLQNPGHTVQISQVGTNSHALPGEDPTKPSFTTGASPDSFSYAPSISDDGRFVSFVTQSEDIVPTEGPPQPPFPPQENTQTLVVCDRDPNGTMQNGQPVLDQGPYACFEVRAGDVQQETFAAPPKLSGDGTMITWAGSFTNGLTPIETSTLTNTPGGTLGVPTLPHIVPLAGIAGFDSNASDLLDPVLTGDAGKVVYRARTCDANFVCHEAVIETTLPNGPSVRVDVDPSDSSQFLGDPNGGGWSITDPPATSADGSRVAFAAANGTASLVFVSTLNGKTVDRTVVESRDNSGNPAAGYFPALSGDGHYLAFLTDTSNMHDGIDNFSFGSCEPSEDFAPSLTPSVSILCQVVARDLSADLAGAAFHPSELVSSSVAGDSSCMPEAVPLPAGRTCAGDDSSSNPSVDATGSEIGFDSNATDLVANPADTNDLSDSFVHTWRPTLTAPDLNFGKVSLGKNEDQPLTLTESTDTDPTDQAHIFGPISPGSTPISGAQAADYTVTSPGCTGKTLNPDPGENTCALTVRFTPSTLGTRKAKLAVNTGRNGFPRQDPHVTVKLTGVGVIGQLTVNPTTLNFGTRALGAPQVTKTVTLTDTGTGALAITSEAVSDTTITGASGDYTVDASGCPAVLQPGGSCTISVSFQGQAAGDRGAQLVITDDGANNPTTIVLVAKVTSRIGQLTVSPTTLDFGQPLPLAPPLTKTVTLKDTGTGSVAITSVAAGDTTNLGASSDYTVDATGCPAVLQPGGSCTISVSFVGHAVGDRGAQLVITDDTSTPTSTVPLVATVPNPTVTANPGVTPPGRVTTISGTGFAPGKVVDVTLAGFGESAKAKADKHGAFSVGLVIFRNTPEGPQTVHSQTRGQDPSISADGPLLLAVGSVDILQLVTRH